MIGTLARPARSLKQAVSDRLPKRRDESGLTTLEWLLIVAAVAGLAALAVVLVTNVVDDTSEQISGGSARETAATVAADQLMNNAMRAASDQPSGVTTFGEWSDYYNNRCNRIEITYGDAGVTATANFTLATTTQGTALAPGTTFDPATVDKGDAEVGAASTAPASARAVAECGIS